MFFSVQSAKVFSMLIILIDRWQVLSYLIRMPLLKQANHAIWQKSWSASIVLNVFSLDFASECLQTRKKRACPFSSLTPRRKKTTKSFCKVWASKLAESDNCSYYNQEQWLKDDKASEKPIETTAKLSFTSFLASGASFLGREAARRATNSRQVPHHIKIGRRTFLKSIVAGEQLQEKLQEVVCCRFFQGSVELLENVSSNSCLAQNENCPSQITKDAFPTTEGSNRAEPLK